MLLKNRANNYETNSNVICMYWTQTRRESDCEYKL